MARGLAAGSGEVPALRLVGVPEATAQYVTRFRVYGPGRYETRAWNAAAWAAIPEPLRPDPAKVLVIGDDEFYLTIERIGDLVDDPPRT